MNAHSLMLEALKLAEWGGTVALSVESKCPVCGGLMTMSHRPDCKLAAAIRAGEQEATYTCPVCGSENVREENYKYLVCPDCVAPRDEVVRAAIAYAEAAIIADSYVPPDDEKAKQIMYCVRSKVAAHKRLIEAVKKYKGEEDDDGRGNADGGSGGPEGNGVHSG